MRDLVLQKGGKLISKKEGDEDRDYTDLASECLFDVCTVDEDVTLADVFFLINRNLDKLSPVLGNWCEEYVKEGLKIAPAGKESEVEYVELYWHLEVDNYDDKEKDHLSGFNFPRFHGIGFVHEEDWIDKWGGLMAEKGTRTNYAIEFTPAYELAKLPLKLNSEVNIYKDYKHVVTYHNPNFTLGHILYGIMWELSFCGPPAKRDDMRADLDCTVKGIMDGTIETEPLDIDELFTDTDK